MSHYPVIIIGGGTMGSAAAWALAKRGVPALVLEQFDHVHDLGSHSGKTRIIRHAYAEGADYVPLVQRADTLWQELAAETETELLIRTGGLDLAAPGYDQAQSARRSCQTYDLPYEWLNGADVSRRWPAWRLPDDWEACYSPDAGFLLVEPALKSLAAVARRGGATIQTREPVRDWGATADGAWVTTDQGRYTADRLIVTAGAWAGHLFHGLGLPLTVVRKVVWWFAVADEAVFAPERFPIFIVDSPHGELYGLPTYADPGLKVGVHSGGDTVNPDTIDRTIRPDDLGELPSFLGAYLPGASDQTVSHAVCMYTRTPDTDFIIDRHPEHPRVVLAAGFSGHGFKFAPAIGEHLADLALSEGEPYGLFALGRFT